MGCAVGPAAASDEPQCGAIDEAIEPLGIADVTVPGGIPRTLAVGVIEEGVANYSTVISVLGFQDGEFTIEPGSTATVNLAA